MTAKSCVTTLAVAVSLLFAGSSLAIEYEDYKANRLETEYFEIAYSKSQIQFSTFEDGDIITRTYPKGSLSKKNGSLYIDGDLLFDETGLLLNGQRYYYDSIYSTAISEAERTVSITFYTRKPSATKTSRFKRGNMVAVGETVTVGKDDFVRGMILAVGSDIEVYGEVNRDIIAILGEVYVGPEAVARGDVAAVDGSVEVADDASIYGEIYDVTKRRIRLRYRFVRDLTDWDFLDKITYDRVDGLSLYAGVAYRDSDSLLPSFSVRAGYGFNSERWRYHIGIEQTLIRQPSIVVGAGFQRRLVSEYEWLIGDAENTTFALLATEDFRDYYEAEGGYLCARTRPIENLTVEAGYRLEETHWLEARRHLWSLFGGNKLFPKNFNTVEDRFRAVGVAELDTTQNGTLYARTAYDTRDEDDPFDRTAWFATLDFEWSSNGLNSDFDYRRYVLAVRRYQKVHRRATVIVRAMFGGSDGYLPMYKRFFLGGLGTLQGYDHKEFMGTRFWMTNAEYRIQFPKVESAVSLFWDAGQIANDRKLDSSVEIKHDLGIALYFEDDFRISLAKRLDRSFDDNPIFYVRLDHVF
ncbi:MAG: BamA/TamA family outer membrane protein [Candidatus Zixiibacteriota bacterium]|nr:MAG: BamA/TamA family outer membrane protein [candidate division Zixibacteria bacterium]